MPSSKKRKSPSTKDEDYQEFIKRARSLLECENDESSQSLLAHLKCLHPGLLYADNSTLLLTSHLLAMGDSPLFTLNKPSDEDAAAKEEAVKEADKESDENGSRIGKLVSNNTIAHHVQKGFNKHLFTPFLDAKVSFIRL